MRRASEFMLEEVSYRDTFVWYYLPDFSRRWGELEATPTMAGTQPRVPRRSPTFSWMPT